MKNNDQHIPQPMDELAVPTLNRLPPEEAARVGSMLLTLVCVARYHVQLLQTENPSDTLVPVLNILKAYGDLVAVMFDEPNIFAQVQAAVTSNVEAYVEEPNLAPSVAADNAIRTLLLSAPSLQCGALAASASANLRKYHTNQMR